MAIMDQFAGLDMKQLIGGPLGATADASIVLANSTADFINKVGFDANGNVRTAAFKYQKRSVNEDGTSNLDEMKVDVPMLAIVPIPNLQVDEVNILFDMEVKQSEREDKSFDVGATLSGSMNLGIIKVNISGNVSVHNSNTRSSDNSAKYHVDVRATNHGTPEGLARVLDMMAANVAPSLVGSTLKDGNGNDLSEEARIKAERLKGLRQDISQIEKKLSAAQDGLNNSIQQMKRIASDQQSVYQSAMNRLLDGTSKDKQDETALQYGNVMSEVSESWNIFQNRLPDTISQITATKGNDVNAAKSDSLSEMFALKALKQDGNTPSSAAYGSGEAYYASLVGAQNNAVTSQMTVNQIEMELFDKKAEYSDAISGKTTTTALNGGNDQEGGKNASSGNTGADGKKSGK
jgi:hypothetical protein